MYVPSCRTLRDYLHLAGALMEHFLEGNAHLAQMFIVFACAEL